MITRIVKMHFMPGRSEDFLQIFEEMKAHIAHSKGCSALKLHQDLKNPDQFFTLSQWETEQDLDHYRQSELFKLTWARVKPLFAEPAQAWSLQQS